jgi:hypothetical protein
VRYPCGCNDREEVLEVDRPSRESVEVVDEDGVAGALLKIREHLEEGGSLLARIGGEVVVDIFLGDCPPEALRQGATVGELAADAQA